MRISEGEHHPIDVMQAALEELKREYEANCKMKKNVEILQKLAESRRLEVQGMGVLVFAFLKHLSSIFHTSDVKFHVLVNQVMQSHNVEGVEFGGCGE